MKKKVAIKENSWFAKIAAFKLKANQVAIVFNKTIHLHNTTTEKFLADKQWLCHELMHVKQYQQYGISGFLIRYLWESIKKGYYNNKFEKEARDNEHNLTLLDQFNEDLNNLV